MLLADRHANDVFVPACKTGATWDASYRTEPGPKFLQFDAWVLRKSWVAWGIEKSGVPVNRGATIGYEIKVSRSDFRADKKWQFYLPLCHRFFFVCPTGLIRPDELPREAGLLWVTKNGNGLRTVKDAPARVIDPPVDVLLYALICRTVAPPQGKRRWRRSLEDWYAWALARRRVGKMVAAAMESERDDRRCA